MNRICIQKSTKQILEMQSGGDDIPELMESRLNTLKQNAINAGFFEADLDVKWVTEEELNIAIEQDPNTEAKKNNQLIQNAKLKLNEIDLKSIRTIREYISLKDDSPQFLKEFESQAVEERKKVKQ